MTNRARVAVFVFNLSPRRLGGIEVHTREVVRRLGELGWRAILCFSHAPPPQAEQYLSLPNVTWETLMNGRQTTRDLARILRRYRPSLLHLQFTTFLGLNAWVARLNGVRQIVYTDHNSRPEGHQPKPAVFWKRLVANVLTDPISLVIGVSDYNCRVMSISGFIPSSRVRRIYNGADLARINAMSGSGESFRRQHGIPLESILVTQVSSMIPEKGIRDVLEAARLAIREEPNLHFVFVGDGKHRDEYEQRAVEIGIGDHITWTGLVVDPIGEGVFAATDVACQASRWEEAFGLVIAEAMAFGKPVIATRVGAIPELVLDGETGFLVSLGDTAGLAEKIILLARDRKLRECMGQAGRRRAEAEFDVRKNVGILVDFYGLD